MKKRVFSFLIAVALLVSLAPTAWAEEGDAPISADDFLFAIVTDESGGETVVTDADALPEGGDGAVVYRLSLSMRQAELRRVTPVGLRFVTEVDAEQMDALLSCDAVESVRIGTHVFRASNTDEVLDVAATVGAWYEETDGAYCFAGSLVNLKVEHYGTRFSGVGYVSITLTTGEALTVYADAPAEGVYGILAQDYVTYAGWMTEAERAVFSPVPQQMHVSGLEGLNVMAIGDSLFDGDDLSGSEQWIGLLAKECDWNFTNLGRDGWTVAYNPGVYQEGQRVRNSMYDYLFNHSDTYRFGGDGSYSRGKPWGKTAADVDLILLEGGVNDYGWNIPLGTVDDTDGSTLLGAWRLMIERLLVDYPNAQIVFVTSWYVPASKEVDGEMRQRMDYVCYGIRDLFAAHFADEERLTLLEAGDPAVSGINMASSAFRMDYALSANDSNHLNAEGMLLMQKAMRPLLWEIMRE